MLLIIAALGVTLMVTSCGTMACAQGYYGNYGYQSYNYGTVRSTPNPNGLFVSSNNMRPTGTYVVGQKSYPTQLRWKNMSIVKNGLMLFVYDANGQIINQYDMRIPKQDINDVYHPTGFNGKALSVEVYICGGRGCNLITVTDGNSNETYYLQR